MKKRNLLVMFMLILALLAGTVYAQKAPPGPEYTPKVYKNEVLFKKAFSNTTAKGDAIKELTDIRIAFLEEVFAWLGFLEDQHMLSNDGKPWEKTNLSQLTPEQFSRIELLSVQAHSILQRPVGAFEDFLWKNKPNMNGQHYRTGTPLDMGLAEASFLPNGRSYCMFAFTDAKFSTAAAYIRDLVNLELDTIRGRLDDSARRSRELDIRMKYR